jgi:hypothetical protein
VARSGLPRPVQKGHIVEMLKDGCHEVQREMTVAAVKPFVGRYFTVLLPVLFGSLESGWVQYISDILHSLHRANHRRLTFVRR